MDKALLVIAFILALASCCSCHDISQFDSRIVGGDVTSSYALPYQVSLRRRKSSKSAYSHTCGGTLLDERTIVTAAHCVYNRHEENFIVVAGTDIRSGIDGGIVTRVDKLVPHELYNATITNNDIALIFVSSPFPVGTNSRISTIELAKTLPAEGTLATVSGWGTTEEDGLASTQLQQVNVQLVNSTDCQAAYTWRPITEAMLCAAAPGGGPCQGDSGGPLVVNNELLGIVSWGERCAGEKYPSVYSSVPYFLDWIAENRKNFAQK